MFEIRPGYGEWTHCIDIWRQIGIWTPNFEFRKTSIFICIWSLHFTSFFRSTIAKICRGSLICRCKIASFFKTNIIDLFIIRGLNLCDMAQIGKIPDVCWNFLKTRPKIVKSGAKTHHWQYEMPITLILALINAITAIQVKINWFYLIFFEEIFIFCSSFSRIFPNFHVSKEVHEIIEKVPTLTRTVWNG